MAFAANELFSSATQGSMVRVIPESVLPLKFGAGTGTLAPLTPLGYDEVNDEWVPWTALTKEINTLTAASTALASGVFRLVINGEETADIAFDATAAIIQTALEALNGIEPGDVAAVATTGVDLGDNSAVVTLTWSQKLAATNISISLVFPTDVSPTFPTVSAIETADGDWGGTIITATLDGAVVSTTTLGSTTAVATIPIVASLEAPDGDWTGKVLTITRDGVTVAAVTLGTITNVADAVTDLNGTEGQAGGFAAAGLFAVSNTNLDIEDRGHPGAFTLKITSDIVGSTGYGAGGVSDTGTEATTDDDTDAEVVAALNADQDFQVAGLFADESGGFVRVQALGSSGDHTLNINSDLATAYGASGVSDTGTPVLNPHVLATSTAGVTAGGAHIIKGFVYPDSVVLAAGGEVIGQGMLKGKLRYDDVVLSSGEAQGDLDAALADGPLARGLIVMGLVAVR